MEKLNLFQWNLDGMFSKERKCHVCCFIIELKISATLTDSREIQLYHIQEETAFIVTDIKNHFIAFNNQDIVLMWNWEWHQEALLRLDLETFLQVMWIF